MSKKQITWSDIETCCRSISNYISEDGIKINAIIGLSRGGLVPATIVAHLLKVREVMVHGYHSYDDSTNMRDSSNPHGVMYQDVLYDLRKSMPGRNILIVDDLCDHGITMKGLVDRTAKKFHRGAVNILTAALYVKEHSRFVPDYTGQTCGNDWLIFPWELNHDTCD